MHWGTGFWPMFPLFWIGIIAFVCWCVSRRFVWRNRHNFFASQMEPDAMEILRRRYARGEIDATAFDHMRERLEGSARPRF